MVCLLRALVVALLPLFFKLVLSLLLINRFMAQTLCQKRFQREIEMVKEKWQARLRR